ncbi:MAG: zinc ribbon domain-containing protein [Gammaproteobacteria bacterium]|nr:MAG: zinc ribbon domain-containing protein [Gammaproteobacteria bacterium]
MPIYEYECKSCGSRQEVIQKLSDAPLKDCPDCGEAELKKLVSAAGFRLKGSGWYETDFKSGGKRNVADSGKVDAVKPAAGSGSCCSGGACAAD